MTNSLDDVSTHHYLHRREQNGLQAPLKPGKYTMICDVYECDRKPRLGESGTAYRDYAMQQGRLVKTSKETHVVEACLV
jgi:hypothetical protein